MYSVLIVDDEKIIRIGLRTLIHWESCGFKIVGAVSDGKQALEVIEKEEIDLVLTDIKMPNLDGIELVKCLDKKGFAGEIIMLTSYGEFELARECLRYGAHDYLLKGTLIPSELMEAVQSAKEKLDKKPKSVKTYESKKFNQEDLARIGDHFMQVMLEKEGYTEQFTLSEPYTFLLFKYVQSKAQKEKVKEKALMPYQTSIENIIAEALPRQGVPILFFENEWCLYILPKEHVENKEEVHKIGIHIQNLIKLYTNIKIIGVVSRNIYTSKDLLQSLKDTKKVAGFVFYEGYDNILDEEMISLIKPYLGGIYIGLEERLHQEIKIGHYTETVQILDTYMEEMQGCYMEQKEAEMKLNALLQNFILDYGIYLEGHKTKLNELVEQYRKSTLFREMHNILNELIHMICTVLLRIKNKNYRKEIIEVMHYIDTHIGEKITLNSIATQINMNESYISRLFKSETGMNIIHYINMIKMEKAKELLKEKNMIVKDVAYALGFEEQSYFNRMFNKYFGINPKEYKKCTNISQ